MSNKDYHEVIHSHFLAVIKGETKETAKEFIQRMAQDYDLEESQVALDIQVILEKLRSKQN